MRWNPPLHLCRLHLSSARLFQLLCYHLLSHQERRHLYALPQSLRIKSEKVAWML